MPTPYEVLELKPNATAEEVRKAYKKLVLKHHPDKGGNRDIFEKVKKAYEELSHPEDSSASSSFSAPLFNFNFDINAYRAELELERRNKPPEPEHWRIKFLSKNKTFGRYAEHILSLLKSDINNPLVILDKLFDLYIESDSIFTRVSFWGYGRTHIPLVKELKKLLHHPDHSDPSAVMNIPEPLANVFSRIEKERVEFNPNGEFIELFNAFFAMYPIYLVFLNNTHQLKKQISLTVFDDVLAQTVFRLRTREFIYSTRYIHHFTPDDIDLIVHTGELTQAVNFIIHHIMDANDLDQFSYISNLAALTEQAPAVVIENIILPFTLNILQKGDPEKKYLNYPWVIVLKAIQVVNPIVVEKQILSLFISSQHLREDYHFCAGLVQIALRLGKVATEKYIFPLLVKLLDENKGKEYLYGNRRQLYLVAINKILHLVPPEMVLQLLAPKLGKYVEVEFGAYKEAYQLYARLLELEQEAEGEQKLKWTLIVNAVTPAFEEDTLDFNDYQLIVMPAEVIQIRSTHLIKSFSDPDKIYFSDSDHYSCDPRLSWLDSLSELPEEKVSAEFKNNIFEKLYAISSKNFTAAFVKTLHKYFRFGKDPNMFADLYERLFEKADFTSKRACLSPIEPALTEIAKYVDPQVLQTKLLPFVLSSSSPKIEKNSLLYQLLKNALARIDSQYVMQKVFPEFFYRIVKSKEFRGAEGEVDLLIPFISKLSYERSVQIKIQLIQAIEDHTLSQGPKLKFLHALLKHHQVLIREFKPPDIEHNPLPASGYVH